MSWTLCNHKTINTSFEYQEEKTAFVLIFHYCEWLLYVILRHSKLKFHVWHNIAFVSVNRPLCYQKILKNSSFECETRSLPRAEGGTNPLVDSWKPNPSTETRHCRIQDIHTWHRHKLFKGPSKNPPVEQQTYVGGASAAEARIDGVWLHQQYEYNPQWKVCFVWNIWYGCHQM